MITDYQQERNEYDKARQGKARQGKEEHRSTIEAGQRFLIRIEPIFDRIQGELDRGEKEILQIADEEIRVLLSEMSEDVRSLAREAALEIVLAKNAISDDRLASFELFSYLRLTVKEEHRLRDHHFSLIIEGNSFTVQMRKEEMRNIFLNLYGNSARAISSKWSEEDSSNGKMQITVLQRNRDLIIQFTDNGIGIPEEVLEKIRREESVTTKKNGRGGQGIGLVREIVREYGGTLAIESEEGVGTTVTIQLPIVVVY